MDRNRHSTSVNALPALTSAGNPVGYFTKGDPAHGISASVPTQDWFNGVTEELVNVIEESGQTLNIADNKQLVRAVSSISKRKNWIINGDFQVWSYGTVANNPFGYSTADRWFCACNGTGMVVSQQFFFPYATDGISHPVNFIQTQITAGVGPTDHAFIAQVIEDVANLSGRVCTLSFWARSPDGNKAMSAEIGQYFGTGGAPSPAVRKAFGGQVQVTTEWQKFTFTGTLPSVEGKSVGSDKNDGVGIVLYFDGGSDSQIAFQTSNLGHQSGTFQIARIQFEDGALASDFEDRPVAVEEAMCQRYHWRGLPSTILGGAVTGAGHTQGWGVKFPTTMRSVPTITFNKTGISYINISDVVAGSQTREGCLLVSTSTTSAGSSLINFGTSSYIDASCELPLG